MRRRILFTIFFIALGTTVFWYTNIHLEVPHYSFAGAATIGDARQKVMVTGHVAPKDITADGGTLTFYMIDSTGAESKIFYDGQEQIDRDKINAALAARRTISVSGHSCGDRFHTSGISFQ